MLSPKKIKHRKVRRGVMKGRVSAGGEIAFGQYAIQAQESGWITSRQIEAARIAMNRKIKRGGKIWIRIFPDKPVSKKPAETRMGKGKGGPEFWVAVVRTGRIMFELTGVDRELGMEALRVAAQKLPIKVKVIEADEF